MHFEYEIDVEEYVSSQILYYKLSGGRKRIQSIVSWLIGGALLVFVAWNERTINLAAAILAGLGAWWIYAAITNLFPARYYRRAYRQADLAGKKFIANLDEDGFEVTGELCGWRVQWPAVSYKGEDPHVFMLCSRPGTLFMFGKKYMDTDQQEELRRLCGLKQA